MCDTSDTSHFQVLPVTMADSDSDRDAGSDAGSDAEGDAGFDPAKDLSKLSDKERKKWDKNLQKWRMFLDFIFRHIAIATFRYNCFEHEELTPFMIALEKAEALREQSKLKKGETAKITSFKTMKESTDLLIKHRFVNEANRIKRFLDIAGRMRGISMIAGGYFKALKKGKVKGIDKVKYYLDYWKGFTVRSFDYTELEFLNADPQTFNSLEKRYLIWPTVVRTALNLSQKFLKKTSESTGLELLSTDPKVLQQHMQAAEFVVAAKIEDMLFQKVNQESKSFILGGGGCKTCFPFPQSLTPTFKPLTTQNIERGETL